MTNSPNPSRIVAAQLARLGVPRKAYDAIVSSGDVTVSLLVERAAGGLFHLGPPDEIALFEEVLALRGVAPRLVPLKQADFVLCTGLADPWHEAPADYDAILAAMRARNLELICANPDIVVEDGGKLFYCAGAIAERYAGAGGKVIQAGKPFAPIFARALELARGPGPKTIDRARVLVIGDAMRTDIKGAHDQGFDSLFVTSGIHRKELHGSAEDTASTPPRSGSSWKPRISRPRRRSRSWFGRRSREAAWRGLDAARPAMQFPAESGGARMASYDLGSLGRSFRVEKIHCRH